MSSLDIIFTIVTVSLQEPVCAMSQRRDDFHCHKPFVDPRCQSCVPCSSPQSELCSVMLHAHSLRNVIAMLSLVVRRSLRFSGLACSQALSSIVVLFGYTRYTQGNKVHLAASHCLLLWFCLVTHGTHREIKCSIKCMDRRAARHCLL